MLEPLDFYDENTCLIYSALEYGDFTHKRNNNNINPITLLQKY